MNIIRPISDIKSGYCIRLANGQGWRIIATAGVTSFVEKLASIMELQTCNRNGQPKLIFILGELAGETLGERIGCLEPNIGDNLPRKGWRAWKLPVIRLWFHRDVRDVFCEIGRELGYELDILRMLFSLYPIFEMAQDSGGIRLHAALVERDGIGILLAASGNTGKSTCCRRLPGPWIALCDDEALVVRDHKNQYLVHPLPTWSDYLMKRSKRTWDVRHHVPLSMIFFLEQAEADEVVRIGQGQAAGLMTGSAMQVYDPNWNNLDKEELRVFRKKLFDNACELAKVIPTFRLRVSLKGRFWEEIEKVLSHRTK